MLSALPIVSFAEVMGSSTSSQRSLIVGIESMSETCDCVSMLASTPRTSSPVGFASSILESTFNEVSTWSSAPGLGFS